MDKPAVPLCLTFAASLLLLVSASAETSQRSSPSRQLSGTRRPSPAPPESSHGSDEPQEEQQQRLTDNQQTKPEPSSSAGRQILGFYVSHGLAQVINRSADVDISTLGVRWTNLYRLRGSGLLRGRSGFSVELVPAMTFDQQPRAYASGFNLVFEQHFGASEEVTPVFRIGAGFLYGNRRVPPTETRHNFTLLTGLGLNVKLSDRSVLALEYRLHHVSNAGIGFRNPGINAHTILLGLGFYLR